MNHRHAIHEPEEELLTAEDAIADADRLEVLFEDHQKSEKEVSISHEVPLSVLLAAIDRLNQDALQEVARRATERLTFMDRT